MGEKTENLYLGSFGYNWKLKTETEKHCSKIIFKCVNNIVGPIFNEKVTEKWCLWVLWTEYRYTVHERKVKSSDFEKKKKVTKTQTCIWKAQNVLPKCTLIASPESSWLILEVLDEETMSRAREPLSALSAPGAMLAIDKTVYWDSRSWPPRT